MNRNRLVLIILLAAAVCFSTIFAVRLALAGGNREPAEASLAAAYEPPQAAPERININTASAQELQRLPGVGEAIAARVIAYRESCGAFRTPEELMAVPGIGENLYFKIQYLICTGDDNDANTGS